MTTTSLSPVDDTERRGALDAGLRRCPGQGELPARPQHGRSPSPRKRSSANAGLKLFDDIPEAPVCHA